MILNRENKPYPKRYYVTYLWTWYVDIIMFFFVGVLLYRFWGARREWVSGCLAVEFRQGSWPRRTWFKKWLGASLGHTLLFSEGRLGQPNIVDSGPHGRTERHELRHTLQFEVMQLLSALYFGYLTASSGFQWQYLLILPAGAWLAYAAAMVQAFIRGESPYRENIFEDHAYATDD